MHADKILGKNGGDPHGRNRVAHIKYNRRLPKQFYTLLLAQLGGPAHMYRYTTYKLHEMSAIMCTCKYTRHTYLSACMHEYMHTSMLEYNHARMHTCILAYMHRCFLHVSVSMYASTRKPYFGELAFAHHFAASTMVVPPRNLFKQLCWRLVRIARGDVYPLHTRKMI